MKIRIIGTGIKTYIKNLKKILSLNVKEFLYIDEGLKSWFVDANNKTKIIEFTSFITGKQNIEAFEAYGFIRKIGSKYIVALESEDYIEDAFKKAITKEHKDKKIQSLRNTKLLALSDAYSKLKNEDLSVFNINQSRGLINLKKIRDSINDYERSLIKNDPSGIIKIRRALYEQINKEF